MPDWGLLCGAGPGSGLRQLWAPQLVPVWRLAEAAAGGQHVIWKMVSGVCSVVVVTVHCVVCSVHT